MKTRKPISTRELQNIRDLQRQLDFIDNHPNGRFALKVSEHWEPNRPKTYTLYVSYGLYNTGFGFVQTEGAEIQNMRYRPSGTRGRGGLYFYDNIDRLIKSARKYGVPDELIRKFSEQYFIIDPDMMTTTKNNAKRIAEQIEEEIKKFII